jgi:hypothetical protein
MMNRFLQATAIALGLSTSFFASAQTGLKVVETPYVAPSAGVPVRAAPVGAVDDVIGLAATPAQPSSVSPAAAEAAAPAVPPPVVFDVTPQDTTVREVLVRWSQSVGWTHQPSHWTLDRDFPIAGTADGSVFGADFKEATRRLLSSTELTDRPVQPCFYTNRILRVVPKAELCDKTVTNN